MADRQRRTFLKQDLAALGASQTFKLAPPSWAHRATLTGLVTADGSGAGTVQVRQDAPDGTAGVSIAGLVTDALTVGQVNVRVLSWGEGVGIEAGASYDSKPLMLSEWQTIVVTESAGALTLSKVWVEFEG